MISFRPRERVPRIGLVGWFGSGNIGNDGTLEALLGHLRTAYPQAAVDVLTNAPDVVTERYGLPATQLHWLHSPHPAGAPQRSLARRAVRVAHGAMRDACLMAAWVRRHDVAIVPGTGSLETTTAIRPWQLPWSLFILSASGRLLGTRVALVSVGASVVTDRLTRWLDGVGRSAGSLPKLPRRVLQTVDSSDGRRRRQRPGVPGSGLRPGTHDYDDCRGGSPTAGRRWGSDSWPGPATPPSDRGQARSTRSTSAG